MLYPSELQPRRSILSRTLLKIRKPETIPAPLYTPRHTRLYSTLLLGMSCLSRSWRKRPSVKI
jgi:hypothetical protein